MPKPYLKNNCDTVKSIIDEDKWVHAFPKGISLKVNVIELLEIELTYFEAAVQHFNHYTMGAPHSSHKQ